MSWSLYVQTWSLRILGMKVKILLCFSLKETHVLSLYLHYKQAYCYFQLSLKMYSPWTPCMNIKCSISHFTPYLFYLCWCSIVSLQSPQDPRPTSSLVRLKCTHLVYYQSSILHTYLNAMSLEGERRWGIHSCTTQNKSKPNMHAMMTMYSTESMICSACWLYNQHVTTSLSAMLDVIIPNIIIIVTQYSVRII